jgi:hypothetical protein
MSRRIAALLFSLAVISASPARAADPAAAAAKPVDTGCNGTVSGAVTATFTCDVTVVKKADGVVSFTFKPRAPVKGLKAFHPGTFSIKTPIGVKVYSHRDLVSGSASATTDGGKKFKASEKPGDLGDFEVQVGSVERNRGGMFGTLMVHAHMVPADAKDKAEIQVSVESLVGW